MDKRYLPPTLPEQLELRREAVDAVLAHPQWTLQTSVRHLKKQLRLTTQELALLAGVGFRTLQDIEQGRSEGTVRTLNQILGVLGLRLGVVRDTAETSEPTSS